MVCQTITEFGIESLGDFFVYPTSCNYYFYAIILFGLFTIFSLLFYYIEKKNNIKPDFISSLGVSSLLTFFLALIGTLITGSTGIPIIQRDIFIYVFAFCVVFVGIWMFKKD